MRHCVIGEAANQELAGTSVDHGLHQSLANTLCCPAVHLAFGKQRVDDLATVVHNDVTQQSNMSCFRIDFYNGQMRTVAENKVLWVEDVGLVEAGRHSQRQVWSGMRRDGNVGEANSFDILSRYGKVETAAPLEDSTHDLLLNLCTYSRDRCAGASAGPRLEYPVLVNEIGWTCPQFVRRDLSHFIHNPATGLVHGRAADGNGPRIESTRSEWHDLRVALHDCNMLECDSQHARSDLRETGGMTLTRALCAAEDRCAAVIVNDNARALVSGTPETDHAHRHGRRRA